MKVIGNIRKKLERYINSKSQSTVQMQRLENYSSELLDILEQYADEIGSTIVAYNKKSCEETMMIKGLRKSSQDTTNRKTHMENVEGIAVEIAKKLGLHVGATRVIARNHDLGHTFLGHSGEWWLSNIKEDYGMGYYCHNALGPAELIYRCNIYDEILDRIREFNPKIKETELRRIKKALWLLFDGINSHNGEKTESEFIPDKEKTESKFHEELEFCFTKKGFDKGIMPATLEGCLIRLCDKISYIPYDMLDGLREGIIDKIDGEYIPILTSLGISEEEIESCNIRKNYESIARKLQIIFTKDVIQNSTNGTIRMSDEISVPMHELRNINNRRIVKYVVLQEDNDTYPAAIKTLMERFSDVVLSENCLPELVRTSTNTGFAQRIIPKYEGTPYEGFVKYLTGITINEYGFTIETVREARRQSIEDEQERARQIVLSGEEFISSPEFPNRDARIQRYIEYYRNLGITGEYSEEDKKRDILQELESIQEPTLEKLLSLEFGAKYLATLNDFEFFDLLKSTGLITEKQVQSLTRKYKEIGQEGLKKEVYVQSQWKEIMQNQEEETKKTGISQGDTEGPEL